MPQMIPLPAAVRRVGRIAWLLSLLDRLRREMHIVGAAHRGETDPVDSSWFETRRIGLHGITAVLITAHAAVPGVADDLIAKGLSRKKAVGLEHSIAVLVHDLMHDWSPTVTDTPDPKRTKRTPTLQRRLERAASVDGTLKRDPAER